MIAAKQLPSVVHGPRWIESPKDFGEVVVSALQELFDLPFLLIFFVVFLLSSNSRVFV